MIGRMVKGFVQGSLGGVDDIAKTLVGSQLERDRQDADHQASVTDAYMAEFVRHSNRTWWDSLIDGLNRSVRPVWSYFVLVFMAYGAYNPAWFAVVAQSWSLAGTLMTAMFMTVVGFWFGGRFLSKDMTGGKVPSVEDVKRVLDMQQQIKEFPRSAKTDQEDEPPVFTPVSTSTAEGQNMDDIKARLGR